MTKRAWIVLIPAAVVATVALSMSAQGRQTAGPTAAVSPDVEKLRSAARAALRKCHSIPNGGKRKLIDSNRAAVCLPARFYPKAGFKISFRGATAGYVSNWEGLCSMAGGDCWGEGYQFSADESGQSGTVEFFAKSAVAGVPDYRVHFTVVPYVDKQ